MSDNLCYKCRTAIPRGAASCPKCGAPAPLPDEEIDKHRIRSKTGFDASGRIIIPESGGSSDDSSTRIVMPDDSSTRIVMPDDSSTRIVMPDDSSTRIVMPDDSSTRIVMPDDSSTRIVMPDDSSTRIVTPGQDDNATRVFTPTPPPAPAAPAPAPPRKPAAPQMPPKKKKKRGGTPLWVVLAVVVAVFGGAIGAYVFFAGSDTPSGETRYVLADAPLYPEARPTAMPESLLACTPVRLLERGADFCKVSADGGREGYVPAPLLVSPLDMGRLNSILSSEVAQRVVRGSAHRQALINFVESRGYEVTAAGGPVEILANPNPYRFAPTAGGSGWADARFGRFFEPASRYEDMALVLHDMDRDENMLLYVTVNDNGVPVVRRQENIGNHRCIDSIAIDRTLPTSQRVRFITR